MKLYYAIEAPYGLYEFEKDGRIVGRIRKFNTQGARNKWVYGASTKLFNESGARKSLNINSLEVKRARYFDYLINTR